MGAKPCTYTHLLNGCKEEREATVCWDYLCEDGGGKCCFYPAIKNFTGGHQINSSSSDPFVTLCP